MRFTINTSWDSPTPTQRAQVYVYEIAVSIDTSDGQVDEDYANYNLSPIINRAIGDALSSLGEKLNNSTEHDGRPNPRGNIELNQVLSQKWNCSETGNVWLTPTKGYASVFVSPDSLMYSWEHSNERMLDLSDPDDKDFYQNSDKNEWGERMNAYPKVRRRTAMSILRDNINRDRLVISMLEKVREFVRGEAMDGVKPDDRYRY